MMQTLLNLFAGGLIVSAIGTLGAMFLGADVSWTVITLVALFGCLFVFEI